MTPSPAAVPGNNEGVSRQHLLQVRNLARLRLRGEIVKLLDLNVRCEVFDKGRVVQQQQMVQIAQRELDNAQMDLMISA